MADDKSGPTADNRRRERRHAPYDYLPYVEIFGEPDQPGEHLTGFVRNESRNGFSAQFNQPFPYEEGDVLDLRVGYQRAWARVAWVEGLTDELSVVGFQLHPEEFLERFE